ncbi:hypothetical protein D5F01_LYC15650 [Larimichthys crocea]|uniref:Uncharacterized protein n=1 Tax=Larimichthys crocea TaxID=215358 RepID=A0A6G0I3W9_LARCR|nr:hypothetical protein D5F01_LYC15650 [Larimichthys crocea]
MRMTQQFAGQWGTVYTQSPITTTTSTTAALGGERIPSRASIYIHSPLFGQPPGFLRLHSHDDTQYSKPGRGRQPLLSASPPRSCSRPPVLDHITSALPARIGARWWPTCDFSLRQRIPEQRGAVELPQPAGQSETRTQDARRTETQIIINLPVLFCNSSNEITHHRSLTSCTSLRKYEWFIVKCP